MVADEDNTRCDTNPQFDRLDAACPPLPIVGPDRLGYRARRPAGSQSMIGLRVGRAPEGHQAVADVFVDRAALCFNTSSEQPEVFVEQGRRFRWPQREGQLGEAGHVSEHDGNFALGCLLNVIVAVGKQLSNQCPGQIQFEPLQGGGHGVQRLPGTVSAAGNPRRLVKLERTDLLGKCREW
jgi:hypothetical protein